MAWDTCNVTFTSGSNGVFYTNDIVTGSVIFDIRQKIKINDIIINVKGISKASWTRPLPTIPYIKIYSEKREIFSVLIDVFKDLNDITVNPGILSRQFHFFLPSDLPSTYKDSIAKIYYKIKIKSKSSWTLAKKENFTFTVINHVDLSPFEEYKIPMLYEVAKTFGKRKHFVLHFKTYKGFSCNENMMYFEAIIKNEKKIKVNKIKVALIQKLDYNILSGYYSNEKTLCESYYKDIPQLFEQSCYFQMEYPQLMPSTINVTDPMVNISYCLRVKVEFYFHFPLYSDIPIFIGTVALNNTKIINKDHVEL